MGRRHALRDDQWERIKDLLPGREGHVGVTARDTRFTGSTTGILNMRQGKVERLHAWMTARGLRLKDYKTTAYSDSINDLPLLEAVKHPVTVNADAQLATIAAQRGWPALNLRSTG